MTKETGGPLLLSGKKLVQVDGGVAIPLGETGTRQATKAEAHAPNSFGI